MSVGLELTFPDFSTDHHISEVPAVLVTQTQHAARERIVARLLGLPPTAAPRWLWLSWAVNELRVPVRWSLALSCRSAASAVVPCSKLQNTGGAMNLSRSLAGDDHGDRTRDTEHNGSYIDSRQRRGSSTSRHTAALSMDASRTTAVSYASSAGRDRRRSAVRGQGTGGGANRGKGGKPTHSAPAQLKELFAEVRIGCAATRPRTTPYTV